MSNVSGSCRLQNLLDRLWDAGDDGLRINETTPGHGGVRSRDINKLIQLGRAEWIVNDVLAKAKYERSWIK